MSYDSELLPSLIKEDESTVDFYKKTTWFEALTRSVQRHSEFMRPETVDSYAEMENIYPDINIDPEYDNGDYDVFEEEEEEEEELEIPTYSCTACYMDPYLVQGSIGNDVDAQIAYPSNALWCWHEQDWIDWWTWKLTGTAPAGFDPQDAIARYLSALAYSTWTLSQTAGKTTNIRLASSGDKYAGAATYPYVIESAATYDVNASQTLYGRHEVWDYRPELKSGVYYEDQPITVKVERTDEYGNYCYFTQDIHTECCNDTDRTTLAWNTGLNPTSWILGQNTVYLLGGCPPFEIEFTPSYSGLHVYADDYTDLTKYYTHLHFVIRIDKLDTEYTDSDVAVVVTVTDKCEESINLDLDVSGVLDWVTLGGNTAPIYWFGSAPIECDDPEDDPTMCDDASSFTDSGDEDHRWVCGPSYCGLWDTVENCVGTLTCAPDCSSPSGHGVGEVGGAFGSEGVNIIRTATVSTAGSGYTLGEQVHIHNDGAGEDAEFYITGVDGSGAITKIACSELGKKFTAQAYAAQGGTGSDAEITVTVGEGYLVTLSEQIPCSCVPGEGEDACYEDASECADCHSDYKCITGNCSEQYYGNIYTSQDIDSTYIDSQYYIEPA